MAALRTSADEKWSYCCIYPYIIWNYLHVWGRKSNKYRDVKESSYVEALGAYEG